MSVILIKKGGRDMDKNNFIMSYSVDKTFESDKFLKIRCRVCHDEESPNKT